jgi:serine/threonine protein kinase
LELGPDESALEATGLPSGHVFGGRYQIVSKLGEGAFGSVYRGLQLNLQQDVAIKVLKEELCTDDIQVKRFYNEARIYARINNPHVVTIHDFGQDESGSTLYIVMEFLEGKDLSELIADEGAFGQVRVVELGTQMAQGLKAAHGSGIIHRDLKPANVMVLDSESEHPFAQLLDFGIGKLAESNVDEANLPDDPLARDFQRGLTRAGKFAGTPAYMSPEQCMGEPLDVRTDIYSMGCLLYEMVTGLTPFMADNLFKLLRKHVSEAPIPPSARRADGDVSPELDAVILRCLEKQKNSRYQNAGELLEALESVKTVLSGPKMISLLEISEETADENLLPVSRRSFGDEDGGEESIAVVRQILATLSKAYKSFSLYPRDNPVVREATGNLIGYLETYFENYALLELTVDRFAIYYEDVRVYEDRDLRNSYPFRMFADGIRRFFFHQGIQPAEIDGYFECLRLVSKGANLSSDLVTLMWERRFQNISYLLIDDLTQEPMPEMEELAGGLSVKEDHGAKGDRRRKPLSGDQPKRLDELHEEITDEERQAIEDLIRQEEMEDHTGEFVRALFRALVWTDQEEESEGLVRALGALNQGLLQMRDFEHVVPLLQGVHQVSPRIESSEVKASLNSILEAAGRPDNVHGSLEYLMGSPDQDARKLVEDYLSVLPVTAIPSIVDLFDQMEEDLALPLFQRALQELCAGDPTLLRPGLEHSRWKVVKATCHVLARIPSPDSFKLFEPLLKHSSHLIRQTAVRSLAKSRSSRRAEVLGEMLQDPEGAVRVATIEAFASIGPDKAVSHLVATLQSDSFVERDRQEQQVLYRVLAQFGGSEAIDALASQLGRDSPPWFRRTSRSLLAATSVLALISWPILTATMGPLSGTAVWALVVVVGIAMLRDVAHAKGDRQLELVEPAAICLSKIGGGQAMSVLETASRTGPARVKRICSRVLSHHSSSGGWDGSSQGGS